jgi:hypothetical protein
MMMNHVNKNNNGLIAPAATILTVAIIMATSSMMTAPAAATTTTAETATTPESSSGGLELSPQPVLREQERLESQTPINETHFEVVVSGNGTLTLPDATETINVTTTDNVILSMDGTAVGKEMLTTLDGSESATATIYAIARFNMEEGTGRSITILLFHTNSTGMLAPLDGMILAGNVEFYPDGRALVTLWEWQSGIPLPTTTTTPEEPPLMNTTMTNATTPADDTTATAVPEEEGEGNEEGQDPNEFEDCVVPPGRDPGDVGC